MSKAQEAFKKYNEAVSLRRVLSVDLANAEHAYNNARNALVDLQAEHSESIDAELAAREELKSYIKD